MLYSGQVAFRCQSWYRLSNRRALITRNSFWRLVIDRSKNWSDRLDAVTWCYEAKCDVTSWRRGDGGMFYYMANFGQGQRISGAGMLRPRISAAGAHRAVLLGSDSNRTLRWESFLPYIHRTTQACSGVATGPRAAAANSPTMHKNPYALCVIPLRCTLTEYWR